MLSCPRCQLQHVIAVWHVKGQMSSINLIPREKTRKEIVFFPSNVKSRDFMDFFSQIQILATHQRAEIQCFPDLENYSQATCDFIINWKKQVSKMHFRKLSESNNSTSIFSFLICTTSSWKKITKSRLQHSYISAFCSACLLTSCTM